MIIFWSLIKQVARKNDQFRVLFLNLMTNQTPIHLQTGTFIYTKLKNLIPSYRIDSSYYHVAFSLIKIGFSLIVVLSSFSICHIVHMFPARNFQSYRISIDDHKYHYDPLMQASFLFFFYITQVLNSSTCSLH